MDCRLLILAVAVCLLDVGLAQDRTRSRYVPSSPSEDDDAAYSRGEDRLVARQPVVRQPSSSSRRRQPSVSTGGQRQHTATAETDTAVAPNPRLEDRLPVERELKDNYDLRPTIDNRPSYHESVVGEPAAPEADAPPSDNGQQRRRKRPKKRRRPKPESKQPELSGPEEQAEDRLPQAPKASIEDDYHAYRKPQTPAPVPDVQYASPRGRQPQETSGDTRGQRQSTRHAASPRVPESRSSRRQPAAPANRLPVELPTRSSRNRPSIPETPSSVHQPYQPESDDTGISGGYETNYAVSDDSDSSRLPVNDEAGQTGFLNHRRPLPVHSEGIETPEKPSGQQHGSEFLPAPNRLNDAPVLSSPFIDPPHHLPPHVIREIDFQADVVTRQPEGVSSDRLPSDQYLRSLPIREALPHDRLPEPESRNPEPDRIAARVPLESTRGSYRYQAEEQPEPTRIHPPTDQRRRQVPSSRSRSGTENEEVARNTLPPSSSNNERPVGARLQRTGSRYQPEDPEITRTSPSRRPQRGPEPAVNERVPPRNQRTRQRQEEPKPNSRDEPTPTRSSRTRSRYQPEAAPVEETYSSPIEEPARRRTIQRPDRTRSQSLPAPAARPEPVDDNEEFHRTRSPYEPDVRGPQPQLTPDVPQYQSPPRSTQRRPEPAQVGHSSASRDSSPRQRRPSSRPPQEEPPSRSTPRQNQQQPPRNSGSSFECPNPYGFYPDPNQCDKYYECNNDTAEEGLCPDGLAFNPISAPTYLRCDSVRDIDCSARPELQTPQPTKNCPRRFGLFPDKKDCTKFWHCVDGTSTQVKCPPGLVYDDSKGTCNWADLVKDSCSTEDLLGFTCPDEIKANIQEGLYLRYRHPDNCQLHFTCITAADGTRKPRMLSCNEGFVFDPETSQCTRPENVPGCEEFYGPPPPPRRSSNTRQEQQKPPTRSSQPPPPEYAEEEDDEQLLQRTQRRRRPSNTRTRS